MASSSGSRTRPCSNNKCKNVIAVPKPGWRSLDREVALCYQCFIAYAVKQFCYIYHNDSTSWSFCKFCNKKIHRPCEVSQDWYTTLEDGGIMCNGCASQDSNLVPSSQLTLHSFTSTPTAVASVPQTLVENNQLTDDECLHETQPSTPAPLALESNGSKSPTEARAQVQALNEKLRGGKTRKHELYRYRPRMTDEELKEIFKGSNVNVIPLFEKELSASDTGKSGRLIVPKICAETFFPSIDDAQCQPIEIQDSQGKDWNFRMRMWTNNKSRMYVLEGFDLYVKSMKLCEGDIVTFSRLVPDGKLVIGNRKAQHPSSQGMVTATTSKQVSKGKRTSTTRNPNSMISVESDLVTANGGVGSKRKTCEIVLTGKSSEKKKNNRKHEEVKRAPVLLDSPCGSNVPSDVVEKGFERRRNKETITNTSKPAPKFKTKSTTGNSILVINDASDLITAKGGVGSKRKTCEKNKKLEAVKRVPELVDSPRGSNVPSNVVEKGFEKRSYKKTLGTTISKPAPKCKTKTTPGNSNTVTSSTVEPMKGNRDPEPSEPVETEVTDMENVVTLPLPPKWIKKYPRHRSACKCKVCIQPTSGSKNHSVCQSPGNTVRIVPTSSQRNVEITTSVSSEHNQNLNNVSGSISKCLPFDLNDLPPETDE